ncbi:MAG: hypothetical protein U0800_01245 [Isosphaeraceae bacterium]
MPITLEEFVSRLERSGALSAGAASGALGRIPPDRRPTDGEGLAAALIEAGLLTQFQAALLMRGRGKRLTLGEYVLLDELGRGGMGVVLKARHRRMNRVVVLKVLKPGGSAGAPVERFLREGEGGGTPEPSQRHHGA